MEILSFQAEADRDAIDNSIAPHLLVNESIKE